MHIKSLGSLARTGCATALVLLSACSSKPLLPPVAAMPPAKPVSPAPPPPASTGKPVAQATPVVKSVLPPYLDPSNALSTQRSVFFDFDQSVLKPEGQRLLEMHGRYLASHPEVTIRVEGNTDEQGGAEYNLALGQKRADVVVKTLKILGVSDAQMEAVSFGKEKPRALGHDEESHAENRRADLDYPSR